MSKWSVNQTEKIYHPYITDGKQRLIIKAGKIMPFHEKVVETLNNHESLVAMLEEVVERLEASDDNFTKTTGMRHLYKGEKMVKFVDKAKALLEELGGQERLINEIKETEQ